jgi:hypothetical protein
MKPFELSELTAFLVRHLRAFEKGTIVTYTDLSTAANVPINAKSPRLRYARKMLERDHNQIWIAARPSVGVRRLSDAEIAEYLRKWWLSGARRKLSRGNDQTESVDYKKLDIDEQARYAVDCLQCQAAAQTLSKPTWKRLEAAARGRSNDLPVFNILEWAISLTPTRKE